MDRLPLPQLLGHMMDKRQTEKHPWASRMQDDNLEDFVPFSDAERELMATFLAQQSARATPFPPGRQDESEEGEEDTPFDDERDTRAIPSQSAPPVTTFHLDLLSHDISERFNAVQITEDWQRAETFHAQVVLTPQAPHFVPISPSFRVLRDIFGKSNGEISLEYEQG
jgi:hypothetical protein